MVVLIALGAFISTLLGGLFALRFRDKLHLILGFSAGSVIGVAFFDLLPEAIEAGRAQPALATTSTIAVGFLLYLVLNRIAFVHSKTDDAVRDARRGRLGATTLTIHSYMDGVAIGVAYQVSAQVGLVVTVAVLLHDFSDGINTIEILAGHGLGKSTSIRWLLADAAAPIAGALTTVFFSMPRQQFGRVLALFCGFFLYIGAAELLPESQHSHSTRLTTVATLLGMGVLYIVIKMVS
jgi:ZIP family zinc transporter